ncbi:hypothetical protein PCASD_26733 [Puccinia coronata f. sp. avenae]|uniref:Uncharacterized protein n=1 Tax=Puccinia coronata f. sp. avenae TaxID=200324 RepID=A0A2N5TI16_9BASI|nr:hypothetical protein PCASD_26733 [Puccinia coronata f. sp. avenae]
MHELMGKKAFVNPLYKLDAQKDVETTDSSDSDNSDDSDNSENSDNSDNSDNSGNSGNVKDKDSENLSVKLVREQQSSELVEKIEKSVESFNCFENRQESNQILNYLITTHKTNKGQQLVPKTNPKNPPSAKENKNTRYRQHRDALTAEERALDSSSSNQSLSSEVIIPTNSPKKKSKKNKKKKANANNLATRPSPAQTPQKANKGKRRASNSDKINPKISHSTPASKKNNVFAYYEEYALKRDAGFREGSGGSGKP